MGYWKHKFSQYKFYEKLACFLNFVSVDYVIVIYGVLRIIEKYVT